MDALRFTEDHEWLRLESHGTVTVSITTFAQQQLGDLVFVDLTAVVMSFVAGDEAAVVESVKTAGKIKMPIEGTIVRVNETLRDQPSAANEDPPGVGWLFRISLADPSSLDSLMTEGSYASFVS
ncbi:glycine cleavage system protein GcvH [Paraburkholderia sp. BCC1884]|uniref:glycine cleavage system protein GcvH n=1 Tax=Paraburkholderia sp. BCC1884 TaxID=2562668 RepID=UPI001183A14C|nr:glycine cleavage system protein GcvH [Paraburkholderia sp. BCC1884]